MLQKISKQVSDTLSIPLDIVEEVSHYQWKSAHKGLQLHSSVEVTGLATFRIRPHKVQKRIELLTKYLNAYTYKLSIEESEQKRKTLQLKIDSTTGDIEYLQSKLKDGN